MKRAREAAERRGGATLAVEDMLFPLRHDRPLVRRTLAVLGWKDVQRTAVAAGASAGAAPRAAKMEHASLLAASVGTSMGSPDEPSLWAASEPPLIVRRVCVAGAAPWSRRV